MRSFAIFEVQYGLVNVTHFKSCQQLLYVELVWSNIYLCLKTQLHYFSGFSSNKAESIFAKYRNQQNQGSSSADVPEAPSGDLGTLPERPVVEMSTRPPVAPSTRRSKCYIVRFTFPFFCRRKAYQLMKGTSLMEDIQRSILPNSTNLNASEKDMFVVT